MPLNAYTLTSPNLIFDIKTFYTPKSYNVILNDYPAKFRFFDLGICSGNKVQVTNTGDDWVIQGVATPDKPKHNILLFDSTRQSGPFRRLDLKPGFSPLTVHQDLTLDQFDIDYSSSEKVTTPTVDNCVFESSSGVCLHCASNFEIDVITNTCNRCTSIYLNFLGVCFDTSTLGPGDSFINTNPQNNSLEKFQETKTFEYQNVSQSIELEYITYLPSPPFHFNDSFQLPFIQTPLTDSISLYQVSIDYNLTPPNVTPSIFYFYQLISNGGDSIFYNHDVFDYDTDNQRLVFVMNVLNSSTNPSNTTFNFFLPRKIKDESGNVKDVFLDETSIQEKYLNLEIATLSNLLNQYQEGTDSIVSVRANPSFQDDKVFSFHSILHYKMADVSNIPEGSFLSQRGDTKIFSDCVPGCRTCSSLLDCSACFDGHFLENNICFECSIECETCVDHRSKCLKCVGDGKALLDGLLAIDNCNYNSDANCSTFVAGSCYRCHPEYSLSLNGCVQCTLSQYFEKATQLCTDCITGCQRCSNGYSCDNCLDDYDLQAGICVYDPNCVEGHYFDVGVQQCAKCIDRCYRCVNKAECQECYVGSFVDEAKQCQSCMANCFECIDGNSCLLCHKGYALEDEKCVVSKEPIFTVFDGVGKGKEEEEKLSVSGSGVSSTVVEQVDLQVFRELSFGCMTSIGNGCLFCFPKFVLDGNSCKPCPANCLACDLFDSCLRCVYGFEMKSLNGKKICLKNEVSLFFSRPFFFKYFCSLCPVLIILKSILDQALFIHINN